MVSSYFEWSEEKNKLLRQEREISFEEVILAITNGDLLDVIENPNQKKYPSQKIFVVDIGGYVYLVPFVKNKDKYFLKTIFPSRKMTEEYLIKKRR